MIVVAGQLPYESALHNNDLSPLSDNSSSSDSCSSETNEESESELLLLYSPITEISSTENTDSDADMEITLESNAHSALPYTPPTLPSTIPNLTSGPVSYKIVGDNIDVRITPRYMRTDNKVKSLHYYQSYAVQDRIKLDNLFSERLPSCLPPPDDVAKSLLPTSSDDDNFIKNIKILFSRVLIETLPWFNNSFSDLVIRNIQHR